jgi:hypothetical protein
MVPDSDFENDDALSCRSRYLHRYPDTSRSCLPSLAKSPARTVVLAQRYGAGFNGHRSRPLANPNCTLDSPVNEP